MKFGWNGRKIESDKDVERVKLNNKGKIIDDILRKQNLLDHCVKYHKAHLFHIDIDGLRKIQSRLVNEIDVQEHLRAKSQRGNKLPTDYKRRQIKRRVEEVC